MCRVVRIANGLANPAAGGDLVAVRCGPLADLAELLGVVTLGGSPGGCAAAAGAGLPGGGDVVGERFMELVSVVVREVDFVVGAVETEGDSAALAVFDGVAGQVVDEVRGDLLRRGYYCLSVGECTSTVA